MREHVRGPTITVEIDPNAPLQEQYLGSDEDGPRYGPMSLYDCIVAAAVERVVARAGERIEASVAKALTERLDALVADRLPGIVDSALEGELVVTDDWGHERKKGTVRQLIIRHAQEQLMLTGNGYGRDTVLAKLVYEEIDRKLKHELQETVEAAKAKILDRLTTSTAEQLTSSIASAVLR